MSIKREGDLYVPHCDCCGADLEHEHTFMEAIDSKFKAGWAAFRENGIWEDYCCECKLLAFNKI